MMIHIYTTYKNINGFLFTHLNKFGYINNIIFFVLLAMYITNRMFQCITPFEKLLNNDFVYYITV